MLELNVSANPISDINAVKNMTQLEFLTLRDCEVSDLSPVENLSNMLMFWAGEIILVILRRSKICLNCLV